MKPLNSGHTGDTGLLSVVEVVPILEVDWLATHTPNLELVNMEGCGLQGAESANLNQTCSERAKIDKTKEWTDYLSNKYPKLYILLMIYACSFGLCPLLEVILYRLLSFGGTLSVRCPE